MQMTKLNALKRERRDNESFRALRWKEESNGAQKERRRDSYGDVCNLQALNQMTKLAYICRRGIIFAANIMYLHDKYCVCMRYAVGRHYYA